MNQESSSVTVEECQQIVFSEIRENAIARLGASLIALIKAIDYEDDANN